MKSHPTKMSSDQVIDLVSIFYGCALLRTVEPEVVDDLSENPIDFDGCRKLLRDILRSEEAKRIASAPSAMFSLLQSLEGFARSATTTISPKQAWELIVDVSDFIFESPRFVRNRLGTWSSQAGAYALIQNDPQTSSILRCAIVKNDSSLDFGLSGDKDIKFHVSSNENTIELISLYIGESANRALTATAKNIKRKGTKPIVSTLSWGAESEQVQYARLIEYLKARPRISRLLENIGEDLSIQDFFIKKDGTKETNYLLKNFFFNKTRAPYSGLPQQLSFQLLTDYYHSRFPDSARGIPLPLTQEEAAYVQQRALRLPLSGSLNPTVAELIDCGGDVARLNRFLLDGTNAHQEQKNILTANLALGDVFLRQWFPTLVDKYSTEAGKDPFLGLPYTRLFQDEVEACGDVNSLISLIIESVLVGRAEGCLAFIPEAWESYCDSLLVDGQSAIGLIHAAVTSQPERQTLRPEIKSNEPSTNLIGFFDRTGLGNNSYMLEQGLMQAGIDVRCISVSSNRRTWTTLTSSFGKASARSRVNLFGVNASDIIDHALNARNYCCTKATKNCGFFLWETSQLPAKHLIGAQFVDRILVPSTYLANVFSDALPNKSVVNIRKCIEIHDGKALKLRELLHICPDAKIFTCIGDFGSSIERKNFLGAVQAFKRAVDSPEEGVLILKLRRVELDHWSNKGGHWQRVAAEIDGDRRFRVVEREFNDAEYWGLLNETDCFLSLHKSEGFGYGMAHSLALGRPVVCTNYSGMSDFCTAETSFLVDYKLVDVEPWMMNATEYIGQWAEPDSDSAAAQIREVLKDYSAAKARAKMGQELIRTQYSAQAFASALGQAISF